MSLQIIKNKVETKLEPSWCKLSSSEYYVDREGAPVSPNSDGRKYRVLATQIRYYSAGEVFGAVLAIILSLGLAFLSATIKHVLFHKKKAVKLFIERHLNNNDKAHVRWLERIQKQGFEGKYNNYFGDDINSPNQVAAYFADAYRQISEANRPSFDAAVAQAVAASDEPAKDQIMEHYHAFTQEMGPKSHLLIYKYSQLNRKQKKLAIESIRKLNQKIITDPNKQNNWDNYSNEIAENLSSCKNARNTLYIAQHKGEFAGFAVFYTGKDKLPDVTDLSKDQAYCAWIAIDECARGLGLGSLLLQKIFENNGDIKSFKAHVRESNELSRALFTNMANKGFKVTTDRTANNGYAFTVYSKT